ncbi:MAG: hypothetical protein ACREKE_03045 [bacterium]
MTTKIRHREPAIVAGSKIEQYFQEILQRVEHLESVQGVHVGAPTPNAEIAETVGAVSPLGERESMDGVISFRIPGKWKANIEKRLQALGLSERRYADFYRGAVMAAIGNSLRAKSPAWQAFLKEVEPVAEAKLGTKLTDQGIEGIVRQGMGYTG